ncbi:MAG: hypothetical protein M3171_12295, partial [Actinomycetota bacterium]|nr:hypothetical protein [Actinomycetota bacterium]
MPDAPQPAHRRARRGITVVCGLGLVGGLALPLGAAHAEPGPVYPSADQVASARSAAVAVAGSVADLDGRLTSSRIQVTQLQQAAGDAAEMANGAQVALDQATATSSVATAKSDEAQGKAAEAVLTLSRYAAEVYQGGGDTSQLNVIFGGGGPQQVLDRAAGVDAVGAERARMAQDADSAKLLAQNLSQQATEAEGRRAAASAAATAAAQAAMDSAKVAQTQTTQLEAQQQAMVVQLATLQNTSVQLEQQRQAGIAAEEQRQREEANRRAAEAAVKAAAEKAAQEEA